MDKVFKQTVSSIEADHSGCVIYGFVGKGGWTEYVSGDKENSYVINAINQHEDLLRQISELKVALANGDINYE